MLRVSRLAWVVLFMAFSAFADGASPQSDMVRWTGSEDANGSFARILEVLNQKLGTRLTEKDFVLQEERELAFNHYQRYAQVAEDLPIQGKLVRIWTEQGTRKLIQVEANLEKPEVIEKAVARLRSLKKTTAALSQELTSERTMALLRKIINAHPDDPFIRGVDWKDEWSGGQVVRSVKARGKKGHHFVQISLQSKRVLSSSYREFPQADQEITLNAEVYPVYEEVEGEAGAVLPRIKAELKHIYREVPRVEGDIFAPLKTQRYFENRINPVLGETEAGRAQGYWSMSYLMRQAAQIQASLPRIENSFSRGMLLQGRYATINIHPDAIAAFPEIGFKPEPSSVFFPKWGETEVDGQSVWEMLPSMAFSGKPLFSADEAMARPARRLPDHDPIQYINDGFDELQVYYAVNVFMEALHERGFQDRELSTRPFHAFLFDPDIAYRDNAYYTGDTINFTTYSEKAPNYARDNSTIWHELGHGVMDRLMGEGIVLADTGGLGEGMADFLAALVLEALMEGKSFPGSDKFRIINKTGFFLTNEVHDDGEAYGGAMKDFSDAVIQKNGRKGLHQITDLILEAMRLTRDHPGLTAEGWFEHVLFADSLGREGLREKGELGPFLLAALNGRNFRLKGGETAYFTMINAANNQDVVVGVPGSRQAPILVTIKHDEMAEFELKTSLKSSDEFKFKYPAQIKVQYEGAPIQGAIDWVGEENGTQSFTLQSESDVVSLPIKAKGTCDQVNRADGSCVDYVYVLVFNQGEEARPAAKKRFYLRIKNPAPAE